MKTASWVIVHVRTGRAVFETFRSETADKFRDNEAYKVLPIQGYLSGLNEQIKEGTTLTDER